MKQKHDTCDDVRGFSPAERGWVTGSACFVVSTFAKQSNIMFLIAHLSGREHAACLLALPHNKRVRIHSN